MRKSYLKIAVPSGTEGLLLMLISSADLIMVGHLGTRAVAAVGILSQPKMVILSVMQAIAIALTAVSARRMGSGDLRALRASFKQILLVSVLVAAVLVSLALVFLEPLLLLAGARSDYLDAAKTYGLFVMAGLFFASLSVVIGAALIGTGQAALVMSANVAGSLVNTAGNALLIHGLGPLPRLDVAGAGIATLVGNLVAFLILFSAVCRRSREANIRGRGDWIPGADTLKTLLKLGSGALAEQGFERIGMFAYSRLVAGLGTTAFATHNICMNICDIYYSMGQGLGKASSAITGQRLGQKRPDLAIAGCVFGQKIGLALASVACLLFLVFRVPFLGLFSADAEVLRLGSVILVIVALVSFPETQALVCSGALKGAGDVKYVAAYSFWDIAVLRPVLTWLFCFPLGFGLAGAWIVLFMDQSARAILSTLRFRSGKWAEIDL